MLGSILGDIAGSTYEFVENKRLDVPLFPEGSNFTDDTIMTVATADAILGDGDYTAAYRRWGIRYPDPMGGYGVRFREWLETPGAKAYGSWGNGSAMRVAPIGWAFDTLEQTKAEARRSAEVTHNHPEGIKGAETTAVAIWLARHGSSKDEIRQVISETYGYDLTRTCDETRPTYRFNESCQEPSPKPSPLSSTPPISRTRSTSPLASAAMLTPSPASPAAWPKRSTARSRTNSV